MQRRYFITNSLVREENRFETLEDAIQSARRLASERLGQNLYVLEIIAHTHIPPQAIEVTFVNRELRPIAQELENEMMDQLV